MRPYQTFKLEDSPDMADLRHDGRSKDWRSKDARPVFREPVAKREVRRHLKRVDRSKMDFIRRADTWLEEFPEPCMYPGHKPPMFICIPPGHELHHVCPACGVETVVHSPRVMYF